MNSSDYSALLTQVIEGNSLSFQQSEAFFEHVICGNVAPEVLAAMLTALKMKKESATEIAGAANAIRQNAQQFQTSATQIADCVGTGGDGANTINISTTAALLAAACGLPMAKHGNRSVSSMSGSADLLEALGININMNSQVAANCLAQTNFTFLYAPNYHLGFKYAAPVRKVLGIRTLFNILGPLVNPAKPKTMLLGVYTPNLLPVIAQACLLNQVEKAWIVHGNGLDELAVHGHSHIMAIEGGAMTEKLISPTDFGFNTYDLQAIKGGTPEQNAEITLAILAGQGTDAQNTAVALNCAALLYIHGLCASYKEAGELAMTTLKSGKALATLHQVVTLSNQETVSA
jgi:anthranilate phosphoribosyltransferase